MNQEQRTHSKSQTKLHAPRSRPPRNHQRTKPAHEDEAKHRKILSQPLSLQNFVILDIETTGGNPEKNCITEIFAEKLSDTGETQVFHSLVNPKMPIPPIVRRMTGITNAMVKDAPTIDTVMPQFLEFIENKVVVSHNAQGDLKFLEYFTQKTTGREFRNFYVCTHILAEKLFPDADSKSLKGLAKHFHIEPGRLHRAEADVVITKALFERELELLQKNQTHQPKKASEVPMQTIEQIIRFQGDLSSLTRLGWSVDPKKIQSLPHSPGVATLYDEERKVLHIAASPHLQKDFQRFPQHEQLPRAVVKLSLRAHDIDFERSFTMFEALMHECDLLEQHPQIANPAPLLQRIAYGFHCHFEPDLGHYVLGIRPVDEDTLWAFGPIFNHREGHDVLRQLAELFDAPGKKDGIHLKKTQAEIVHAAFSQRSLEVQHKKKKQWYEKLIFWKKTSRNEENFKKLTRILKEHSLISLLGLSGILVVPLEGSGKSAFYLIAHSLPFRKIEFRSDSIQDFLTEMDGARLKKAILAETHHHEKGLQSPKKARLINSFLWWHFYSPHKKEGRFLTLDALESMMKSGGKK